MTERSNKHILHKMFAFSTISLSKVTLYEHSVQGVKPCLTVYDHLAENCVITYTTLLMCIIHKHVSNGRAKQKGKLDKYLGRLKNK